MIIHHIPPNVPAHQKGREGPREPVEEERRAEESPGGGEGSAGPRIPRRLKAGPGAEEGIRGAAWGKVKAITVILLII